MKRAWEITTAAKEAAVPHLKPKAVRGPAFAEQPTPEQAIRKQISDPVADSGGPQLQLFGAIQAVGNRGRDVCAAEALIPAVWQAYEAGDDVELAKLVAQTYALLEQAPKDPQSPYWSYPEYRNFEDLLAEVTFPEKTPPLPSRTTSCSSGCTPAGRGRSPGPPWAPWWRRDTAPPS